MTKPNQNTGVEAYLKASGTTQADLERSMQQMQKAIEALPEDMNGTLLIYFICGLRKAYGLSPEAWVTMLSEVVAETEGVRVTMGTDCTCDRCQARRESGTGALLH